MFAGFLGADGALVWGKWKSCGRMDCKVVYWKGGKMRQIPRRAELTVARGEVLADDPRLAERWFGREGKAACLRLGVIG
jgi:hypothetical protein